MKKGIISTIGMAVLIMGTLVGCGKQDTQSLARKWNAEENNEFNVDTKEKPIELTGRVIVTGDTYKVYDNGILEIIGEYSLDEEDMSEITVNKILTYEFDKVYVTGEKIRYFPNLTGKNYELYIDENVKIINTDAFKENNQITKLVVYGEETAIENNAFYGCTELKEVKLQGKAIDIGYGCFEGCVKLENVKLPEAIKNIRYNMFYGCESLKEIKLPNSVEEMGDRVFYGCINLQNISLSDNLRNIGENAFKYCCELSSVEIPKTVECLYGGVFEGCVSLSKVVIDRSLSKYEEDGYFGQDVKVLYN